MKKVILLLVALLPCLGVMGADVTNIPSLYNAYNDNAVDDRGKVMLLKKFLGDTVSFKIEGADASDMFRVTVPDTVWIKKRPKKNPEKGKHYVLNEVLDGEYDGTKFVTPVSVINGRKFAITGVEPNQGDRYSLYTSGTKIIMTTPGQPGNVEIVLNRDMPHDMIMTSSRLKRILQLAVGSEYYCGTNGTYSGAQFKPVMLSSSDHKVKFDKQTGLVQSVLSVELLDIDGNIVDFKPENNRVLPQSLISVADYKEKYELRTINSEIDYDILAKPLDKPFSFSFILGTLRRDNVRVTQTIDPQNAESYKWESWNYSLLPETEILCIVDRFKCGGTEFYTAVTNGKAFFVPASDVVIDSDYMPKLDSLVNASDDVRKHFMYENIVITLKSFSDYMDRLLKEMDSYKAGGLVIEQYGVYDESEYTDGTGFKIEFINPTEQMIKYINITFQGYNAVDDPVGRPIVKKCIGPVYPGENATYVFEYAWFTDIVEYAKIRSLSVQYKNGKTKVIPNADKILISDKLLNFFKYGNPVGEFK